MKERRTELPPVRSPIGVLLQGGGRTYEVLAILDSHNEPYRPPPVREEQWSSQESRLEPHSPCTNVDSKCGGVPRPGSTDREFLVCDDRRWIHRWVELPNFDGTKPIGWIARVEQYFNIQGASKNYKIPIAFVGMEGQASHWFKWLKRRIPNLSEGAVLKKEMIQRYSDFPATIAYERLAALE